jgi:hypothetical protein
MQQRAIFWLDVVVKVALVGLLAFGAFSGLHQFEGKAFGWRLLTYPITAAVVPLGWSVAGRRPPYPYALDVEDTLGDMSLGLAGSTVAALGTATMLASRRG